MAKRKKSRRFSAVTGRVKGTSAMNRSMLGKHVLVDVFVGRGLDGGYGAEVCVKRGERLTRRKNTRCANVYNKKTVTAAMKSGLAALAKKLK